jgi:hypothetical protein
MFITTAEFLPHHQRHRRELLQLITTARARGHTRLAEMNQQVADNLERTITALEADPDPDPDTASMDAAGATADAS